VKVGNTLVWFPPGTVKEHLWIVMTDQSKHDGYCVVVNLTHSLKGKYSHIIHVGQHSYVSYKDCDVNYGDAFLTTHSHLQAEIDCGHARQLEDITHAILLEILNRAQSHPAFPPHLRKYL
jgi:hypothetical protein